MLAIWETLPTLDLKDKLVAMYGMGDQIDYGEWFLDALGMLYHHLLPSGVKFYRFFGLLKGMNFTSLNHLLMMVKHFLSGLAFR